jgi:uncharacterized protein
MEKIRLEIVGLSYSQSQSGAYALILEESEGKRRLPIIIGSYEAQAIAVELEKMTPTRPLTHDLFKTFATEFGISVIEVIIYNLQEGIFYAKLICQMGEGDIAEIDARTSDAIALAVRFKCPVYTFEFILTSIGFSREDEGDNMEETPEEISPEENESLSDKSLSELKKLLAEAESEEKYEIAAKIRDELNKRKNT